MNDRVKTDIENIFKSLALSRNIQNYEIIFDSSPSAGEGYTGHFYMGQVKNKNTGEIFKVAIKRTRFESGVESIFKNENLFYSIIFSALDKFQKDSGILKPFDNVPLYFCGSTEQGKEYVAMENLKARGYTLYDQTKYLDREHLEYIFKIYGKFHALCFMFKKENPEEHNEFLNNLTNVFDSSKSDNLSRPIKKSFSGALLALDRENEQEVYIKGRKVLENIAEGFVISAKYNGKYSCINHGDCWSNNMLFKYDDLGNIKDIKLVDFQLCRETTPIHDLSYLFYSGASEEDFNNLDSYLDFYHESFSEFVKAMGSDSQEIFPIDILKKEWIQNALWGIFMSIYLWQIKLSPKDKISEIMVDNNTSLEEKSQKWEIIIKALHKTTCFREKTTPILIHAVKKKII